MLVFLGQVIIRGSLLAYNVSQSEIDMCIISHGKNVKNKLSSAQVVSASVLAKHRLLSLVLPHEHQLVFKIRFASSKNESGPAQWSGLIPLKTFHKGSNQSSWLVKSKRSSKRFQFPFKVLTIRIWFSVPLRNHKEHFQSVWCQLTFEVDREFPLYLVSFVVCRKTCLLQSVLNYGLRFRSLFVRYVPLCPSYRGTRVSEFSTS